MADAVQARNSVLSKLRGDEEGVIEVEKSFQVQEGTELIEGVLIGPILGEGLQGVIHDLLFLNHKPTGWVIKAAKKSILAKCMPPMEMEWAAGKSLSQALAKSAELKAIMRTGAAVVRKGKKHTFVGLILEHVNGKSMDDVLRGETILHAHVIQEMLLQVFKTLAFASKACGFQHWDLCLANIMEHQPPESLHRGSIDPVPHDIDPGSTGALEEDPCNFKIIDFGHACCHSQKLAMPKGIKSKRLPFTELCFHAFWIGRKDVFRLLMSLAVSLDGGYWRESDRAALQQLSDLIRAVTGIRPKAKVFSPGEALPNVPRKQTCLRRNYLRFVAFFHFKGAAIAASAALRHPFLQTDLESSRQMK